MLLKDNINPILVGVSVYLTLVGEGEGEGEGQKAQPNFSTCAQTTMKPGRFRLWGWNFAKQ